MERTMPSHSPTHSDEYLFGYADAINDELNLAALTQSKDYQRGYADAVHDTDGLGLDLDTF